MTGTTSNYPVQLEIDAAAPQGRLSILFRLILVIPHTVILYFLGLAVWVVGVLAWFAIVFAGRFPEGLLRFTIGVTRWSTRANAYSSLLTGRYPPFSLDEESDYPVRLTVVEQIKGRHRLTALLRIILAIPHLVVLSILGFVAGLIQVAAWLAGIVLGRVPDGLHNFLYGYSCWNARFSAYLGLLVDEYPPFSFR